MTFNKAIPLGSYSVGKWPQTQEIYFQRVSEVGLSQAIILTFENFTDEERLEFTVMFNNMLRNGKLI